MNLYIVTGEFKRHYDDKIGRSSYLVPGENERQARETYTKRYDPDSYMAKHYTIINIYNVECIGRGSLESGWHLLDVWYPEKED